MDCKNCDWVSNYGGKYEYIVTKPVTYRELTGNSFGNFKAYTKDGKTLLISGNHDTVTIHPNYTFDGCTVVGKLHETPETLISSALHDVMYQIGKQVGYKASWTLTHADKLFLWTMRYFGVGLIVRNLWYAGVRSFGALWKAQKMDSLDIK